MLNSIRNEGPQWQHLSHWIYSLSIRSAGWLMLWQYRVDRDTLTHCTGREGEKVWDHKLQHWKAPTASVHTGDRPHPASHPHFCFSHTLSLSHLSFLSFFLSLHHSFSCFFFVRTCGVVIICLVDFRESHEKAQEYRWKEASIGQAGQICAAFSERESVLETRSHKKYSTTIHHRIIIHTYYKMHYSLC